jgi:hypothetical protein
MDPRDIAQFRAGEQVVFDHDFRPVWSTRPRRRLTRRRQLVATLTSANRTPDSCNPQRRRTADS